MYQGPWVIFQLAYSPVPELRVSDWQNMCVNSTIEDIQNGFLQNLRK